MKCIKYLLFVFNLVFFLAGLGLVGLGGVALVKFREYSAFFGGEVNVPAVFLMVTGSFIFVVSFFGCVGAYKENYCMVYTYAFLLGFILLLEIMAVILAYALNIQINLVKPLENTLPNYWSSHHELITSAWDKSQKELRCCGVHGYRDWTVNPTLNKTGSVPDSCCVKEAKDCGQKILLMVNTTTIYTEGCFDKVIYWAGQHNPIIRGAVAGLALLELVCVICACCLARSIRREYEAV